MTTERWRKIEDIYHAALELAQERRTAFLGEACGDDDELRREVESLLLQSAEGLLDQPAWQGLEDSTLQPGVKLGPYEILGTLGAGGMGVVYKARDSRLKRTVAIKVSSVRFSGRFEREARAIAALNHPNICTLHDIGPNYLVMELVDGQPLRGPLALPEALGLAVEIAGALDAAHRLGIVHRDLKPGNILVTKLGVKLLDFGLAKIAPLPSVLSTNDTQTALTSAGMILGTLCYMSPEQVQGKDAGPRSDIFSFGAVLVEMLTGKRAFEGDNSAAVISTIMTGEPLPLSGFGVPPALERVVRRCLAKDPDERWQTARDLQAELRWIKDSASSEITRVSGGPVRSRWQPWALAAAILVAIAGTWLLARGFGIPPRATEVVRSSLLPPPGFSFVPSQFALSPDGAHLAFVAVGEDGAFTLWIRPLSGQAAQQLSGAAGASYPFWSPDSHHVGFFANYKLKTVDIVGGAVQIVSDVGSARGGSWSRDGTIVYARDVAGTLDRVSAAGGAVTTATRIAKLDSAQAHRWPWFLPDGKHFLYSVHLSGSGDSQTDGIYAGTLESLQTQLVAAQFKGNVGYVSGNLLYVAGRSLMAQPFDPGKLKTTGAAITIASQDLGRDYFFLSGFSASENGSLVFQSASDKPAHITWFDSGGQELSHYPEDGFSDPNLSPDGRFLAVTSDEEHNGKQFIRILDLRSGIGTRLTEGGGDDTPVWTRDGKFIAYRHTSNNTSSVDMVPVDRSAPPRTLLRSGNIMPNDWTPDGRLIYMETRKAEIAIGIFSPTTGAVKKIAEGVDAQCSPDGKWIAFTHGYEAFVQPLEGAGGASQVSSGEGWQPRWSRDGKHIFYLQSDRKLMDVEFDPGRRTPEVPRAVLQTRVVAYRGAAAQYVLAADGRILINAFPAGHVAPLTLLSGWTALLREH